MNSDPAPLIPLHPDSLASAAQALSAAERAWLEQHRFRAEPGSHLVLPAPSGGIGRVLAGYDPKAPLYAFAALPNRLPAGAYALPPLAAAFPGTALDAAGHLASSLLLGWRLGAYRFDRYRTPAPALATLSPPPDLDPTAVEQLADLASAVHQVRDWVNTAAADFGPAELADAAAGLAAELGGEIEVLRGGALRTHCPAVYAVGMASRRPPRLIVLRWGDPAAPRLVLAGKGVAFDSGGLNIKNAAGMRKMKKDMGGAAHVLALAGLIMRRRLPVRLTVIIPAVENMIAGNALRPGDIVHTRRGLTIEIGNTDAEGRVILADALQLANEERPDLIVDFATLTGAARVALGPDVTPFFSTDPAATTDLKAIGEAVEDPTWPLPLYAAYDHYLASDIADLSNSSNTPHAGCITAALFLKRFVEPGVFWLHFDTYAWNDQTRPGRPAGGEALGLRALYAWLEQRYRPS